MMFWNSRLSWWLLIFVLAGDFIVPLLLALRYKGYSHTKMVMSVLSGTASSVKGLCRCWLVVQGVLITIAAVNLYLRYRTVSSLTALWLMVVMLIFAAAAGFLAAIFSSADRIAQFTPVSIIHISSTVLGFVALAFAPLLMAVLMFRQQEVLLGGMSTIAFAGAMLFLACFMLSIGPAHRRGVLGLSGLWQRAALVCMYLPLLMAAIKNLMAA